MSRKIAVIMMVLAVMLVGVTAVTQAQINDTFCVGAPSPRLISGQMARVTPGLPNVIRSAPGRGVNSAIIGEIPGGSYFVPIAGYGPTCADGMYWWYCSRSPSLLTKISMFGSLSG